MAENDALMAYAMGQDNNRCNNNGWGADGGWLWILVIFALLGFGGNGWGGFGGNGGGYVATAATQADIQRGFDTSNTFSKLEGINGGLCDGFYAMNTGMLNGFNGVQRDMCTGFSNVAAGLTENRFATQQGFSTLQAQMASCCCETQRQIERGFCDTNYNLATNTTSIIQNAHNDTDRVIAKLDAMEMSRKDETIAALRSQVDALNLAQSQANQNNYLVNTLRPCPIPAYISCNPWANQAPYGSCGNGYGCNSCGC